MIYWFTQIANDLGFRRPCEGRKLAPWPLTYPKMSSNGQSDLSKKLWQFEILKKLKNTLLCTIYTRKRAIRSRYGNATKCHSAGMNMQLNLAYEAKFVTNDFTLKHTRKSICTRTWRAQRTENRKQGKQHFVHYESTIKVFFERRKTT